MTSPPTTGQNAPPIPPGKDKGKGKAPATNENIEHHDICVICLCDLTERAIAYPCNHLTFDFACLASWLQHRSACPLCNTPVQRVEYDWRSPREFKTFHVPEQSTHVRPEAQSRHPTRRRHARSGFAHSPPTPDGSLAFRRLVHEKQAYSLHRAPARTIQHLTPLAFRSQPNLQRKARLFLRRELGVFTHLTTSNRVEFVLELIVGMLKRLEVKGADGVIESQLAEVLGLEGTRLLLHELKAWLESSFDRLEDWDRSVQYADPVVMGFLRGHGKGERGQRGGVGASSN